MATPTIVVLVLVALGSIVTLVWLVLVLVRRLRAVAADVQDLQRRIGPSLERLQQDVEVTNRELERVGRTLDRVEDDASNGPDEPPSPGAESDRERPVVHRRQR